MAYTIPLWKEYYSYLREIHIESSPSDINPHLYVSLSQGRLQLSTAKSIYSFEDKYDNFEEFFRLVDFSDWQPQDTLILGLGLGSIPIILERNHQLQTRFVAVEMDEAVVYLFNKYAASIIESPCEVFSADASAYVQMTTSKYELICSDVFLDDEIPESCQDVFYLECLQRLLTEDGLLAFNCLASTADDIAASTKYFEQVFLSVFPDGQCIKVNQNFILTNNSQRLA